MLLLTENTSQNQRLLNFYEKNRLPFQSRQRFMFIISIKLDSLVRCKTLRALHVQKKQEKFSSRILSVHKIELACFNYVSQILLLSFYISEEKRERKNKSKTYADKRLVERKRTHRQATNYSTGNTSWIQVPTSPSSLGYLSISQQCSR